MPGAITLVERSVSSSTCEAGTTGGRAPSRASTASATASPNCAHGCSSGAATMQFASPSATSGVSRYIGLSCSICPISWALAVATAMSRKSAISGAVGLMLRHPWGFVMDRDHHEHSPWAPRILHHSWTVPSRTARGMHGGSQTAVDGGEYHGRLFPNGGGGLADRASKHDRSERRSGRPRRGGDQRPHPGRPMAPPRTGSARARSFPTADSVSQAARWRKSGACSRRT